MPQYTYQCTSCKHDFERLLKIADLHQPTLEPCPACGAEGHVQKTILGAPAIGDAVRLGVRRTDQGFKEVMQKIHAANPKSNLDLKF
jgi:putative FmdB family regulatory protein